MIHFCFDKINDVTDNTVYPNLGADLIGEFTEILGNFSTSFPFSEPPRFLNYLEMEGIPFGIHTTDNCPLDSFYIISLNFFDHSVDWFARMPKTTLHNIQQKKFKILFYYREGDNPAELRNTLYKFASNHSISINQIHFICQNTVADQMTNFYYLNDMEILFRNAQNYINAQTIWNDNQKTKKFTCLIRSHKSWRLLFGAKFDSISGYDNAYGSYNEINVSNGFDHTDNTNALSNVDVDVSNFVKKLPFSSDTLNDSDRNAYETHVDKYFSDAYWNIVCETHLNLDSTIGTFITEKTWKPIRHNQPFVILGTVNSLSHLRSLGYKTFDGIIDESYDYIKDDGLRFNAVFDVIANLNAMSMSELHNINSKVKDIVQHNSALFNSSKRDRLMKLIKRLLNDE